LTSYKVVSRLGILQNWQTCVKPDTERKGPVKLKENPWTGKVGFFQNFNLKKSWNWGPEVLTGKKSKKPPTLLHWVWTWHGASQSWKTSKNIKFYFLTSLLLLLWIVNLPYKKVAGQNCCKRAPKWYTWLFTLPRLLSRVL
jgi:hypothetical protein